MGALISSKVNQWTLLVGSLPLAYILGTLATPAGSSVAILGLALPLDVRQVAEVWLTASQSLFGVAILANLVLDLGEALLLAGLFLAQFVVGGFLRASLHNPLGADQELIVFSVAYLVLSVIFAVRARKVIGSLWRRGLLSDATR